MVRRRGLRVATGKLTFKVGLKALLGYLLKSNIITIKYKN
jgi:hypothetical protein